MTGDDATHFVKVGYVGFYECIVGFVLDVLEIGKVAGIGEFVKVDDVVFGIFVDEESYYVVADKTGSACDKYVTLHFLSDFLCIF